MTRNNLLRLTLLSLLLLPACYLHRDAASLRMTIAVPDLPMTLDPHREELYPGNRGSARYVHAAIFDALTAVNEKGEVRPALATSWKPIGPTAWEFKLRRGVKFQNGEEFNAQAVSFNIRRVLRPDLRSPVVALIPTLFRGNASGLDTVVISTRRPDPILPRRLSALYMVAPNYVQEVGDDRFGKEPVGTGPWKPAGFAPGDHVTLEASKGSWRGAPQVRFIELRHIPDGAARARALSEGSVDVALDVPIDQQTALRERGLQLQEVPVSESRLIVLDSTAPDAPLANVKVRQALNYAVDKENLVKNVVGAGIPLAGQVVGKEANGYSDNDRIKIIPYPYNLAEARKLMAEAGFADGFDLRIFYTEAPDGRERRELAAIAGDLEKIKVRVTLQGNDRASHLRRRLAGSLSPAFYDTFPYYPAQDASLVMDFFGLTKTETLSPTYDVEDFEEIYKLTRTENDPALRRQALQVSMGILAEHPPAIYLYQPVRVHALKKGVVDLKAYSNLLIDFDRASH